MSAADFLFDRDLPAGLRAPLYANEVHAATVHAASVRTNPLPPVDATGSVGLRPVLMRADGTHVAGVALTLTAPGPGGGGDVDLSAYYDRAETDALLTAKADQAAVDIMVANVSDSRVSHAEMTTALAFKANNSQVTAKADLTYVDSRLSQKADKSELADFVTAGQMFFSISSAINDVPGVDLSGYYDKTAVNAQLAQKADLGDMVGKASQAYVDSALLNKVDRSEITEHVTASQMFNAIDIALTGDAAGYSKTDVDAMLTAKADQSTVNTMVANVYDTRVSNEAFITALSGKASTGQLAAKADIAFVNSQLMDYVRSDLFEDAINLRVAYEDLDPMLALKADKSQLVPLVTTAQMNAAIAAAGGGGADLSDYYTRAETDDALSYKASVVEVVQKADFSYVAAQLAQKALVTHDAIGGGIASSVSLGARDVAPEVDRLQQSGNVGANIIGGIGAASGTTPEAAHGDFMNNLVLGHYALADSTATVLDCTVIGHNNIGAEVFRAVDAVIIGNDCVRESVGDIERSVLIGNRITNPTVGLDRTVRDCVLIGTGSLIELNDGNLIGHVRIGDHRSESVCIPAAGVAAPAPSGGVALHCDSNGNIYRETSSRRFKSDIVDVSAEDVDRYDALVARRYVVTANQRVQFGVVAEEIFEVLPELVTRDRDGVIDGVVYQQLHALAMASAARLRARVDSLEARLLALESK